MSPSLPELREVICGALSTVVDLDPDSMTDDLDLADLGFDSLDLTTLLLEVEDRLGFDLPADVMDRIAGLADNMTIGGILAVLDGWKPGALAGGQAS